MPAASSGVASGINARVARDANRAKLRAQKRLEDAQDNVQRAEQNQVEANQVELVRQEFAAATQAAETSRQRRYTDEAFAEGVLNDDWSRMNDNLRSPDMAETQNFFMGNGIFGFNSFNEGDDEQVRQRDLMVQEDFGVPYDELSDEEKELVNKDIVVYNKGAGEIEVADKWDLPSSTGLTERNTKFRKGFEEHERALVRAIEAREARANAEKSLGKDLDDVPTSEQAATDLDLAQRRLATLDPNYRVAQSGEGQAKDAVVKFLQGTIPHLGPEARAAAIQQVFALYGQEAGQEFLEAAGIPTADENASNSLAQLRLLEGDTERAKAFKSWIEAQDLADLKRTSASLGMSIEEFKAAFNSKEIRPVLDEKGQVTGAWEHIPESVRSGGSATPKQKNISDAERRMAEIKADFESQGKSLSQPSTWSDEDRQRIVVESGIQAELRGLQNINAATLQQWADSVSTLDLGKDIARNLREGDVGPLDNAVNNALKYTTEADESQRQAKGVQLIGLLMATSRNARTSKYLIDRIIDIGSASGNQSAVSTLGGLRKLITVLQGNNAAVEITLGQNPALAPLVKENRKGLGDVIDIIDSRLEGLNGSGVEEPADNDDNPYN